MKDCINLLKIYFIGSCELLKHDNLLQEHLLNIVSTTYYSIFQALHLCALDSGENMVSKKKMEKH